MLAGAMWLVVGAALAVFGTRWTWNAVPFLAPWLAVLALAAGVFKSRVVLDGAARTIVHRIRSRGDGHCLGGFLSFRSWAFVLLMMVAGRLLRGTLSRAIIGPLYLAIGTALVLSSRVAWRARKTATAGAVAEGVTEARVREPFRSTDRNHRFQNRR